MGEFRRVLANGKYALFFALLAALNIFVLYSGQASKHYTSNILSFGRQYKKIISEAGSGSLNDIQKSLEKKIQDFEDAFLAMDDNPEYPNPAFQPGSSDYELASNEKQAASSLLAQAQYLKNYPEYLCLIQERKERMEKFSFMRTESGFALRNVEKTARDFLPLLEVDVQFGSNEAITAFTEHKLTDYLSLIFLMLFCIRFIEDERKGLYELVHSLPRGRRWLLANQALILAALSFAITVFFYASSIACLFMLYGGSGDLGRPIQSISAFQTCTMQISISRYLIYFFMFRFCATFLIALAIWSMLGCFSEIKSNILLLAAVLATQYSMYTYIPEQSYLNVLKYVNLFSYIHVSPLFASYFNLNIFSRPLNSRPVISMLLLPLIVILIKYCLRPRYLPTTSTATLRLPGLTDIRLRLAAKMRLFGFEVYKILVIQKGLLVFVVLLYATQNSEFMPYTQLTEVDRQTEALLLQLEGEISQDKIVEIAHMVEKSKLKIASFEQAEQEYKDGEITYAEYQSQTRGEFLAIIRNSALDEVQARALYLQRTSQILTQKPWFLPERHFKSCFGFIDQERLKQNKASFTKQHRLGILSIMSVCLLVAASYSYENQSGINMLLGTTPRGDVQLRLIKLAASFLSTFMVWLIINGFEVYSLCQEIPLRYLQAPVQSLPMFAAFPLPLSISGFLALVNLIRLLNLWSVACFIMLVSKWCNRVAQATLISIAVFVVPSVMYAILGFENFKFFALSMPVSVMGMLVADFGSMRNCIVATLVMIFCAVAFIALIEYQNRNIQRL
ncbi:MAG: hypothetical protein FWG10_07960 [Eubacteriaceae bacterium]|nr:hypothetical protein [Eubacteriaceae bacterium]